MRKKKSKHDTVRIRSDQFNALLKIATEQQKKLGKPVTVGMIVRKIVDKELVNYDGRGICVNAGED